MTDQNIEAECFTFIRDSAASKDSFGSHERVAKAVAKVVQHDSTFKIIGLLGAWGAGKTSVMGFIERELKKYDASTHTATYTFLFDAWLHQSDPPRRAFLEALIGFLISKGLTTKGEWQKKLDQLNRQLEETESTSTPVFTTAGKILIWSLLAIPIGLEFIGHDWVNEWIPTGLEGFKLNIFCIGLTILALPIAIALGIYIYWRNIRNPLKCDFWTKENLKKHRSQYEDQSILSLLMNKEIQKYRHRVIRLPDPTAIEFQWPVPGFEDTELGVFMEPEVGHGETKIYARVQA